MANIIVNGKNLRSFTLRSEQRQGYSFLPCLFNSIGNLSQNNELRERNRHLNKKGRVQITLADRLIQKTVRTDKHVK